MSLLSLFFFWGGGVGVGAEGPGDTFLLLTPSFVCQYLLLPLLHDVGQRHGADGLQVRVPLQERLHLLHHPLLPEDVPVARRLHQVVEDVQ